MGGRGSSSGASSGINRNSADYKAGYTNELGDINNFAASFFADEGVTLAHVADYMRMYKDAMGESLIAVTQREVDNLKERKKEVVVMLEADKSRGRLSITSDYIEGVKTAVQDKIDIRTKTISRMYAAKGEYEKQEVQAQKMKAKAKKSNGHWL